MDVLSQAVSGVEVTLYTSLQYSSLSDPWVRTVSGLRSPHISTTIILATAGFTLHDRLGKQTGATVIKRIHYLENVMREMNASEYLFDIQPELFVFFAYVFERLRCIHTGIVKCSGTSSCDAALLHTCMLESSAQQLSDQ